MSLSGLAHTESASATAAARYTVCKAAAVALADRAFRAARVRDAFLPASSFIVLFTSVVYQAVCISLPIDDRFVK